jgi:predicted nucleic acid-binding protein
MCIIIDTNTLANVFDPTSINHQDFRPVNEWVINGGGKVVYGGSKYKGELKKYLGLYVELKRKNRAIYIDDALVDQEEILVSRQLQNADFDDQHLVALLRISKCKLICSLDERAYPYFRHRLFFNPAANRPRIYNQYRNRDLLIRRNIAAICQ